MYISPQKGRESLKAEDVEGKVSELDKTDRQQSGNITHLLRVVMSN